jgi:hypothetical protein
MAARDPGTPDPSTSESDLPDPGNRKQAPDMTAENTNMTPSASIDPIAGARLEADLQAHIGRQLRAVYDEVVSEPVPDKFIRLLEELERKRADGS